MFVMFNEKLFSDLVILNNVFFQEASNATKMMLKQRLYGVVNDLYSSPSLPNISIGIPAANNPQHSPPLVRNKIINHSQPLANSGTKQNRIQPTTLNIFGKKQHHIQPTTLATSGKILNHIRPIIL